MTTYNIIPTSYPINIGYDLTNGDIQDDFSEVTSTAINYGGKENVFVISLNSTINSGGSQEIYGGGTAAFTQIDGPGYVPPDSWNVYGFNCTQTVDTGGTAAVTVINNNGSQGVYGTAVATTINVGTQFVYFGGQAFQTTINSGGLQAVNLYGTAVTTTINGGGTQEVTADGMASDTTINTGGTQLIDSIQVEGGGTTTDTTGIATGTTINGGLQKVYGSAIGTTINAGGTQSIYAGASESSLASGTTINAGGTQVIYAGGSVTGTTANAHGWQYVEGGTASGTVLNAAGQFIFSGSATNTTVNALATQSVESGGTATNTTINAGGEEIVYSGGTTLNTTINGGLLDLYAAGSFASGAITFEGTGGTLEIDRPVGFGTSSAFTKTLSGFVVGDKIDLAGLTYGSTAPTVTRSGSTLTITSGGASESVTLGGASASNFSLSKDSTGGILVTGIAAVTPTLSNGGAISGSATPTTPFSGVSIVDGNTSATDSVTIAMSGTGSTLSGTGLTSDGNNGTYRLTGTPATLTSELDALAFRPLEGASGTVSSTSFTLQDSSSAGTTSKIDVLTTTMGSGDNLSITAPAGHDIITGNGSGDTFVFNPNFGQASVTDFYAHLGGWAGHDTISLPTSEFTNFAALLQDASQVNNSVVLTANNGDHLTLANMTMATLKANQSDFKFHA